jgi:hypothetical protein
MTNRQLRRSLLEKLKISAQALSLRVQKLKRQCAMTTEDATYVIAQQEGIILDKYLDNDTVNHVRAIIQQLSSTNQSTLAKLPSRRTNKSENKQVIIKFSNELKVTDPVLEKSIILEAKEMAAVYPLLYILENSIREVINQIMIKKYGPNWWDSKVPQKLRDDATKRMTDEEKNIWHQRRGDHPIDYLDLIQLPNLIRSNDKDFIPTIISSMEWFQQLIEEVYKSRCVVCHMNPLEKNNIKAVEVRFTQWQKLITEKKGLISG